MPADGTRARRRPGRTARRRGFARCDGQLEEYFAGRRSSFDLPVAPAGTAFQQRVWDELQRIGYGDDDHVRRARRAHRPADGDPRRRRGERRATRLDRDPVPSRDRLERSAHRLRRRARGQALPARSRARRRVRERATSWPARLVLLGAIWGMSFVLIKVGNRGFTPVQVSFGRMLFGLLALLPVLLAQPGACRATRAPGRISSSPRSSSTARRSRSSRSASSTSSRCSRGSGTGRRRSSCSSSCS